VSTARQNSLALKDEVQRTLEHLIQSSPIRFNGSNLRKMDKRE